MTIVSICFTVYPLIYAPAGYPDNQKWPTIDHRDRERAEYAPGAVAYIRDF